MTNDISWVEKFKERFMVKVSELPFYSSLSFSGGVESSSIFYAMVELGTPPYECVTFTTGGEENKDTYFARKICKYYDVPLIVTDIPILERQELTELLGYLIGVIGIARNIDVQCCHAYYYIIKEMDTNNLITGFYEDAHYETNKKVFMMYRKMKKGELDPTYFEAYYKEGRAAIYGGHNRSGSIHNYKVIEHFLKQFAIHLHCPFRDKELFELTQNLTFEQSNFYNGKFCKKWFLTKIMFADHFNRFGNAKNSNNMHTQGLKQYHREVLLNNDPHRDTLSVYNEIKRTNQSVRKKIESPTLF